MEEQLPLIPEDRSEGPARRDRQARRSAGATRSSARRQRTAWHLDAETRRVGLEGVAAAKATLRAAREARSTQHAA